MTDLNGIENLNIPHQENIPSVEGKLPSSEIAEPESSEILDVKQKVSEVTNTVQEANETPVTNSLKPSVGYEIPQKPDDEGRVALLAKMMCERISISQD